MQLYDQVICWSDVPGLIHCDSVVSVNTATRIRQTHHRVYIANNVMDTTMFGHFWKLGITVVFGCHFLTVGLVSIVSGYHLKDMVVCSVHRMTCKTFAFFINCIIVSAMCYANSKEHEEPTFATAPEVLAYLSWNSGTVITDSESEHLYMNSALSKHFALVLHARIRISSTTSQQVLADQLHKIQRLKGSSPHNYLLLCDCRCVKHVISVVNSLDTRTNHRTYIRNQSKWLVVTPFGVKDDLKELGDQLDNLALLAFDQESREIRGVVYTLMWYTSGRDWRPVQLPRRHESSLNENSIFPNIANGYNGRKMLITLMEWRRFIIRVETNGTVSYRGMCVDLLDTIAIRLNFTYVLSEPPDRRWGVFQHGVWDGILRQLIDREVNLTIAPLAMSSQRQTVIDFLSMPISFEFTDIAFRKVKPALQKSLHLLTIFQPMVMIAVAGTLVVVWIILTLTSHSLEARSGGVLKSLDHAFFIVFGSLLKVGSVQRPRVNSGRLVVATWGLFSIMMASIYSSSLVANMAAPVVHSPFTSLDAMLDVSGYKWGIVGGEAHQQVIAESKHRTLSKLWHKIIESNKTDPTTTSSNSSSHMVKLMKEQYALVYTRYSFESLMNCQIAYLGEKIAIFTAGMGIPKDSPIKDDLDKIMLNLAANGVIIKLERKWLFSNNEICTSEASSGHKAVTVPVLLGAFYCMAIGCICGGIVLGVEVVYVKRRHAVKLTS